MGDKKKISWQMVVIVILAILLFFAILKNNELSENMMNLENRMSQMLSKMSAVQDEVQSIYDNLDKHLKKQASLLSSVEYSFGDLDTDRHTVALLLTVVPKNITEDMTLSVLLENETAEFTRSGDKFTATVPAGLFIEGEIYPVLSIHSAKETKTELLESVDITYLHYEYLPNLFADIPFGGEYKKGKMTFDSDLYIDCKATEKATITSLALVVERGGKEIDRKDLTDKMQNGCYEGTFNASYAVNEREEFVIYALAKDSLGYTHKAVACYYWYDADDETHMETVAVDGGDSIYDKNGILLNG